MPTPQRMAQRVGRVCMGLLAAHAFMTSSIAVFSRTTTDHFFEQHWSYSTPVLMRRRNYFRFWEPDFLVPSLSRDERECLEAWLRLYSLEAPPLVSRTWSPHVVMQDSLALLDGISELRDSIYALSFCANRVETDVQEIRRERQGDVTFLHCKLLLNVYLRVPLTSYTFSILQLPSTTTLQLQAPDYSPSKLHIMAAENRWWGGRIWSSQTGSVKSPWGDLGDLVRRYNGFMMSITVTKSATVQERMAYARMRAQRVDRRVKELQEAQLAAVEADHGVSLDS